MYTPWAKMAVSVAPYALRISGGLCRNLMRISGKIGAAEENEQVNRFIVKTFYDKKKGGKKVQEVLNKYFLERRLDESHG